MSMTLLEEIKQAKPFIDIREEALLNLQRTAAQLTHMLELRLRPRGLSPTQYNVLRILRGAGGLGLCHYEIGDRLVAQVPDVPRILERMEKAGWVKRERGEQDRRMVMVTLTESGLGLVNELDDPMKETLLGLFGKMPENGLQQLNELLVMARNV